MKQKYSISLGENENELVIKESGELDKGIFSTVFEEKFDKAAVQAACKLDEASLIAALRTPGFYPVSACAETIAKGVMEFFGAGGIETKEVLFNDVSILKDTSAEEVLSEDDENPVEIDKLLEDESNIDDENILEENDIKKITPSTPSIKVADDESIQTDDKD
jgi:hypothetical protein